jgi:citrate synthase
MFAIPRTSGWIAQWLEMVTDDETKIARPRQVYTGERDRDYEPIDGREQKVDPPSGREATSTIDPTAA